MKFSPSQDARYRIPQWQSVLVVLLFLFACACGSGREEKAQLAFKEQFAFQQIHWKNFNRDGVGMDKAEFSAAAARLAGFLSLDPRRIKKSSLAGEFAVTEGGVGGVILKARVELSSPSITVPATVVADGSVETPAAARQLVESGLKDVLLALKEQLLIVEGGPGRWTQALDSAEPDLQLLALSLLGRAKHNGAVEPVARLLGDPREQVAEAAAETLADIGDERAVPLLIGAIQKRHLRSEVRTIEALGRIGGAEAEAYLEMTAMGHEISEVRLLSRNLLKRLRSK